MIIFDFLIYHLTYWFEKKKKNLVWSTPLQRAIYAVMLTVAGTFALLDTLLTTIVWGEGGAKIRYLFYLVAAVGVDYCLEYIYIKRGRYERIAAKGFRLTKKAGLIISFVIVFFFGAGWIFVFFIIVPAGGGVPK